MKNSAKWKKIASILIFISMMSGMISPARTVEKGEIPLRRMNLTPSNFAGPSSKLFSGSSLTMLANATSRQLLSMVIQSTDGSLIVIDGGWPIDAHHLTKVIQERGGHVSAWFITHPHSDHVGALTEILNNPDRPITIDHIYYSLADQAWYDSVEDSRSETLTQLRDALAKMPPESLHGDIRKGQEIQIGSIRVSVLNSPYLLNATSVNNSSVVYKIFLDGTSILILGDLGPEGGQMLLNQCTPEELKSDVVQMAHHGQYGVGREVYEVIDPDVCLWPTPLWLWDNNNGGGINSGDWFTLETRKWMDELDVTAHYSVKDGDWIIR